MTTTAPTVNGRVIALAHYAGRAVLETVLARHGLTFQELVTLRVVAITDPPVERDELTDQVVDALKVGPADVRSVVEELIAKELVAPEASRLRATDAGRTLYAEAGAETGPISARIYADIAAADLATTGRVLALVTERANKELAALSR
jgi:DNA-binding MarR family transcriptional regulator